MSEFLIEYDRMTGDVSHRVFSGRREAVEARIASERRHSGKGNMEIVLLSASTLDEIKRTHGRYFRSAGELVAGLSN